MDSDSSSPHYKRILLKVSGEALMGSGNFGIDTKTVEFICNQIKEIKDLGIETGIVVGGGNIFRGLGASERGMDRVTADNMGMLATVINSLAMMDTLEQMGIYTRVMSAISMEAFAEPYIRRRAFDIWKKVDWPFLPLVRVTHISPLTQPHRFELLKLGLSFLLKQQMSMGFIRLIQKKMPMPNSIRI